MGFFVRLLETIAVLIPDFLILGLVTLACFNHYCIAKTLHVAGTLDTDWSLQVVQFKSRVEQARREPSPATPRPQPVGHENAVTES